MDRIKEIEIAGTKYPLNFSVKAAKEISRRYGDVSKIGDAFTDKSMDEMMDEANWTLCLLIEQGIAYRRVVDEIEIKPLSIEDLEVVMGVADFGKIKDTIMDAIMAGMEREVEVDVEIKNVETTQDQ